MDQPQHNRRRRFLLTTASVAGAAAVVGATVPFIAYMNPSDRARYAGASVQIDVSKLEPGQQLTIKWRGKPIWVLRRTETMRARLRAPALRERLRDPDSEVESQQPAYARNELRSIKPEYLVVVALCTHLGCVPSFRPDTGAPDLGENWPGGYFCPCHGSRFDFAGRVFEGVPAPVNLLVPPHRYNGKFLIEIGIDPGQA